MRDKTGKPMPAVLCPFLERECIKDEATARRCHRLLNDGIETVEGFECYWLDCALAVRMFGFGGYPFHK